MIPLHHGTALPLGLESALPSCLAGHSGDLFLPDQGRALNTIRVRGYGLRGQRDSTAGRMLALYTVKFGPLYPLDKESLRTAEVILECRAGEIFQEVAIWFQRRNQIVSPGKSQGTHRPLTMSMAKLRVDRRSVKGQDRLEGPLGGAQS